MHIDRHNYEEYFILYMDNELSSDKRRMVEAFVQNYPDLKEELDILLQYKLEPDANIVFAGKEDLIKINGNTPVTSANYEEWLTLYIDNELTVEQKTLVEQFIINNPFVKEELSILQKTKLQPDEIVFTNKELLYRREEKVRRITVLWWRVAAAILILALGLTTVIILNNKPSGGKGDVAKTSGNDQKINKENPVVVKTADKQPVKEETKQAPLQAISNNIQNAVANTTTKQTNNNLVVKKDNAGANIKLPDNAPAQINKKEEVIVENNNKPTNNLPQPLNDRNNNDAVNKAIVNNNTSNEIIAPKNSLTNPKVTNETPQSSEVVQASFKDADGADINQPTGKKSKLRGFFRKVTRTFEKRTNIDPTDDNERLLVGGLTIRLK